MNYSDILDVTSNKKSCVTFGFFDGMHLGHRALIERFSIYNNQIPIVLSFEEKKSPVIYSEYEKRYLLHEFVKDSLMISIPFDDVKDMKAESFVQEILCKKLHAASVVVGENLSFGFDDKGVNDLLEYGKKYGFFVDVVPVVKYDGEIVSSNAVKQAIHESDFLKMKKLLGHTYVMIGKIVHGKAQGRQHAMPTANLGVAANKIFPPCGVYATLSGFDDTFYRGLTSVGLRPSADSILIPTIETWLLNFSRNIYDKEVVLELHEYIRGIMTFPRGLDAVRKQIDIDLSKVQSLLDQLLANKNLH